MVGHLNPVHAAAHDSHPRHRAIIVVLCILSAINILREYERGVIFRLGRLLPHSKGPGLILVFAPVDRGK